MQATRYYVRRIGDQWAVRDSLLRRDTGSLCKLERSAEARCDRLNLDYERYLKASASNHYIGYVKPSAS